MNSLAAGLLRRIPQSTLISMSLLVVGMYGLVYGLSEIVKGLEIGLLLPLMVVAIGVGWQLAVWFKQARFGFPTGVLTGLILLLLRIGQLSGKLITLTWASTEWWKAAHRSLIEGQPDPRFFQVATNDFFSSVSVVLIRIGEWLFHLFEGKAAFDPLASAFIWSLAVWLAAFWSGWSLRRGQPALSVLLPALALLSGSLAYTDEKILTLEFLLASTLFLTVFISHQQREIRWQQKSMDFALDLRLDIALSAVPILLGLIFLAALAPSISIRQITETIERWSQQQGIQPETAGQPLGLQAKPKPRPPMADYFYPGLPQSHLIGSGPELSQEVVLVIRTGELPPGPPELTRGTPRHYYWRGLVYNYYTGRGWATTATQDQEFPAESPIIELDPGLYRQVNQEVKVLQDVNAIVHVSGFLYTADQTLNTTWRSNRDLFGALLPAEIYHAASWTPDFTREDLRESTGEIPQWILNRYLQLPENIPSRVLGLARDLTANQATTYDQALSIENYLRTFPYTLDLPAPPSDRDIVDYFLFDLQKGYCDYYATAMVVLARAAGIPARLVMGYATGGYDFFAARYIVTQADAHSWPEIYFPGYGWAEFEPTSSRPLRDSSEKPAAALKDFQEPIVQPGPGVRPAGLFTRIIFWAIPVILGMALIALAVRPWRIWRANGNETTPNIASQIYRQMHWMARWVGVSRNIGDTPFEFANRLNQALAKVYPLDSPANHSHETARQIDSLTNLIVRAFYSSTPLHEADYSLGKDIWKKVRLRLGIAGLIRLLRKGTK